jgi:hypothetical protein
MITATGGIEIAITGIPGDIYAHTRNAASFTAGYGSAIQPPSLFLFGKFGISKVILNPDVQMGTYPFPQ